MPEIRKMTVGSAHPIRIAAPIGRANLVAYPGWRWRHDEQDGAMYHEQIPNRLARFFDWAWRSFRGG